MKNKTTQREYRIIMNCYEDCAICGYRVLVADMHDDHVCSDCMDIYFEEYEND